MSPLSSSVVSAAITGGARLFMRNSPWEKGKPVWGLQYCELGDDSVDRVRLDGVKYLSLSIDILPQ